MFSFLVLCPLFQGVFLPGTKQGGEGTEEVGNKASFSTLPTQVPVFQSARVRTGCKCISVAPVCLHHASTSALCSIFLARLFFSVSLLSLCIRGRHTFLHGSPVVAALSRPLAVYPRGRRMSFSGIQAPGTAPPQVFNDTGDHRS